MARIADKRVYPGELVTAGTTEQNNALLTFRLFSFTLEHVVSVRPEKWEFFFSRNDRSKPAPLPGQQRLAVHPELEEILRVRSRAAQIEVNGSIDSHLHTFRRVRSHRIAPAADQNHLANQC